MSNKYYLIPLNFTRYLFSVNTIFLLRKNICNKTYILMQKYFMFHEMALKLYFMKCSERKVSQCILAFKADPHSTNVSHTTDTIHCQIVFFNLHIMRWTKCSVYLTNLFCLLTISSQCAQQNSYLDLWSITWQGVHIFVKLQAKGTNKLLIKWNLLLFHFTLYLCMWWSFYLWWRVSRLIYVFPKVPSLDEKPLGKIV